MVPRVDGLTRVVSRSARSCAIPQGPPLTSGSIRVANLIDRERRRADWLSFLPAVRSGVEHALACSACLRKAVRMVEGGGEGRVGGIGAVDEGLVLTRKLWLASSGRLVSCARCISGLRKTCVSALRTSFVIHGSRQTVCGIIEGSLRQGREIDRRYREGSGRLGVALKIKC
jgi:hypothetical protein